MSLYNLITSEDDEELRVIMIKAFAENIRGVRLRKKLTQEHVAERAGINPKYLGEIERGLKSPTAVVVSKLSEALGVPVCTLISAHRCPCDNGIAMREFGSLLEGRKEREVRKAVKILEVLFE